MIALGVNSLEALQRAGRSETRVHRANSLLEATALWSRADLDRHLGSRHQGEWIMRVEHPMPQLYTITIEDETGARVLLSTTLYRPENSP
jgi:hypothetical protein